MPEYLLAGKYTLCGEVLHRESYSDGSRISLVQWKLKRRLTIDAYHILDEQAAKIMPGSGGLIVLRYFSGERTPIHDVSAKRPLTTVKIYYYGRLYHEYHENKRAHIKCLP